MNPLMLTLLGQIRAINNSPLPSPTAEDDTFDVVSGTGPWSFNLSLNDTFGSDPVWAITDQTGPGNATIDPMTGIMTLVEESISLAYVLASYVDADYVEG